MAGTVGTVGVVGMVVGVVGGVGGAVGGALVGGVGVDALETTPVSITLESSVTSTSIGEVAFSDCSPGDELLSKLKSSLSSSGSGSGKSVL